MNNSWFISIVGGVFATIIGGLFLRALESSRNEDKDSVSLSSVVTFARLGLYAVLMMLAGAFCYRLAIGWASHPGIFQPIAPLLGIGFFIFIGAGLFSAIFFGKNPYR